MSLIEGLFRNSWFGVRRTTNKPVPPTSQTDAQLRQRTESLKTRPVYTKPDWNYLNPSEIKDFQKRVNTARQELKAARNRQDITKIIQRHFSLIENMTIPYLQHPVLQQFVIDSESGDYHRTKTITDLLKPNFIIGEFVASYNGLDRPSLEAVTCIQGNPPEKFLKQHPSEALSIYTTWTSPGFSNELFVALFPENWATHHKNDPLAKARYIINKFQGRSDKYTLPAINSKYYIPNQEASKDPFAKLLKSTPKQREMAFSYWVSGHEYQHSQGVIERVYRRINHSDPIPKKGYVLKETRETGGLEELRVDINTILDAHDHPEEYGGPDIANISSELILAERLFRYPIQKDPADNYDAISSHLLLNYLRNKNVLNIDSENRLNIVSKDDVIRVLRDFQNEVKDLEQKVYDFLSQANRNGKLDDQETLNQAQEILIEFVREYGRPQERKNSQEDERLLAEITDKLRPIEQELGQLIGSNTDLERIGNLKKQKAAIKKTYYKSFYPLDPFYAALRVALKDKGIDIDSLKKHPRDLSSPNVEFQDLDLGDAYYKTPVAILEDAEDLKRYAGLTDMETSTREKIDGAFREVLKNQEQTDELNVDDHLLAKLAKTNNDDFLGLDNKIIYYGNLDLAYRLTKTELQQYNDLIASKYRDELKGINPDLFTKRFRRIIRDLLNSNHPLADSRASEGARELGLQKSRRDFLLTTIGLTTVATLSAVTLMTDGLEEISIVDPMAVIQPTPITEIPIKLNKNYKLSGSSVALLQRILPLIRELAISPNIKESNILFRLMGPSVSGRVISITGNERTTTISISRAAIKELDILLASNHPNKKQLSDQDLKEIVRKMIQKK